MQLAGLEGANFAVAAAIADMATVVTVAQDQEGKKLTRRTIEHVLDAIIAAAALRKKLKKEDFTATLFTFCQRDQPENQSNGGPVAIKLITRSGGQQQPTGIIGTMIPKKCFAFYAARKLHPLVIGNAKKDIPGCFERPTVLPPSKIYLPLFLIHDDDRWCLGIISINHQKPFVFSDTDGKDFTVYLSPHFAFLKLMLSQHSDRIWIRIGDHED